MIRRMFEQVGGFRKGVWRYEHLVDPAEQADQYPVVFRCVFAQSAMLGNQVSSHAAHREQHKKIRVYEDSGHRTYSGDFSRRSVSDSTRPLSLST